ncbi:MAG: RNA-binding S4 domain-containing protein [Alphaproteobacteria bacterium]
MTGTSVKQLEHVESSLRIDKWLWHCRFFKSRSDAARFVANGKIRVNRRPISKTSHALKRGDILTFVRHDAVIVVEVRALGVHRGPPAEARRLYADLSDAPPQSPARQHPLAPASHDMLDGAYGQPDYISVHAAIG